MRLAEFVGEDYFLLSLNRKDISIQPNDYENPLVKSTVIEVVPMETMKLFAEETGFGRRRHKTEKEG